MSAPRANDVRCRVDPLDVPPVKAARRLGLTLMAFEAKLEELRGRGFPPPDPTTGMYFLPAIDRWMALRFELTRESVPHSHRDAINARIAAM